MLATHDRGMRCVAVCNVERVHKICDISRSLASYEWRDVIDVGTPTDGPTTSTGQDALIGTMIGTHRVVRVIGSGGIGTVYQAEHPVIGRQVAIKVLRPEIAADPTIVERFILEARASNLIGSTHIPRYIDFGRLANGQPFAVMEFLVGETLRARLQRDGRLALDQTVAIAAQVASAMALAHAHAIVHRDLKPDNVFLETAGGEPVAKVLDFGAAKLLTEEAMVRTQVSLEFGTLPYCSPEQALGGSVGPAADVYALGATMFEMLTGQPPFKAALVCLAEKTTKPAPSVHTLRPDLPQTVERDIAAMLARNPATRPSMETLVRLLERWTHEPATPPTDSSGVAAKPARDLATNTPDDDAVDEPATARWRWLWYVAGAALTAAVLIVVVVVNGSDTSDRNTTRRARPPTEPNTAAVSPPAAITSDKPRDSVAPATTVDPSAAPVTLPAAPVTPPAAPDPSPMTSSTQPHRSDAPASTPARAPATDTKRITTPNKRSDKSVAKPDDGVIVDPFKE